MIRADELAERARQRVSLRKLAYQTILDQFSRKVEAAAARHEVATVLVVPPVVLGFPMYPYDEAVTYLERQIRRAGYTIHKGSDPGQFLVSWASAPVTSRTAQSRAPPPDSDLFLGLANLQKTAARLRQNSFQGK